MAKLGHSGLFVDGQLAAVKFNRFLVDRHVDKIHTSRTILLSQDLKDLAILTFSFCSNERSNSHAAVSLGIVSVLC